jgi:hypothetical protein
MTGQPPEDPERAYSREYEDPSAPATQQYTYREYGEPRYRESPQQEPGPSFEPSQGQYETTRFESPQHQQADETPEYQAPVPQFTPNPARYRESAPDAAGELAREAPDEGQAYGEGRAYGESQGYGYGEGSGQAPPPQGPPAPPIPPGPAGRPRPSMGTGKGFFGALFDFSFSSFVTPSIIKALYALFVAAAAATSLLFIVVAFRLSMAFGLFTLLVLAPIGFLLWVAFYRVILEFYMVTFRMAEDIRDLRDRDRESR